MKAALAPAVLLLPLALAGAASARPAGVPVTRLNALISTIQDLRKAERGAASAFRGSDKAANVPRAIDEIHRATEVVEKELRKATAAGLKPAYVHELNYEIAMVKFDDRDFERDWTSPSPDELVGPDDRLRGAEDKKLWMISIVERYIHRSTAPVVPLSNVQNAMAEAVTHEVGSERALEDKPPNTDEYKSQEEKAHQALVRTEDMVEALDDKGLISQDAANLLIHQIRQAQKDDADATQALRGGSIAEAVSALKRGGETKERFLTTLRHAASSPPAKPPARPEKEGPACVAGSWTSPAVPIASPEPGHPVLYFVETPIPNADYYTHRHGFSTGGCDDVGGHLDVQIEATGSDGTLVAWHYTFGTPPTATPGDPPIKVHSGVDCPKTITAPDGSTRVQKNCTIDDPHLSVMPPKEGFEPPAGYTVDRSDFKVFSVIFGVQSRNNDTTDTPGTVTIKIVWQPKK